jgi:hypothetical protein
VLFGALFLGDGPPKVQTTRLRVGPEGVAESTLAGWLVEAELLILAAEPRLRAVGRGVFGG